MSAEISFNTTHVCAAVKRLTWCHALAAVVLAGSAWPAIAAQAADDSSASRAVVSTDASLAWADQPYAYIVVDQDLKDVLTEFGKNVGMPLTLSPDVKGRVLGGVRGDTAREFLSRLTQAHGLTWYAAEGGIHIDSVNALTRRELDAHHLSAAAIARFIAQADGVGSHIAVQAGRPGVVIATGPAAYVATISARLDAVRPAAAAARQTREVRVYRGSNPPQSQSYPL